MSLEINFKISTNNDMYCFWGYGKKIKVLDYNENGEIGFIKDYDEVVNIVLDALKLDCQNFPTMLEKLPYLKIHCHEDYYTTVFNNYKDKDFVFYLCHH
jgi:hypothetical protein